MNETVILCLEPEAADVESFRPLREGLAQRGLCFQPVANIAAVGR